MNDLYDVLGVRRRARQSEIKSAYRRLARKHHPDVSADPNANARFARVNEAYQILGDPARREAYDRGGQPEGGRVFYGAREAEVLAEQRRFDRIVDQLLERDREQARARRHAVHIFVPLFVGTFYVMVLRLPFVERLTTSTCAAVTLLALYSHFYLFNNIALVLRRYTRKVSGDVMSAFGGKPDADGSLGRGTALLLVLSGYAISLCLGYLCGLALSSPGAEAARAISPRHVMGALMYPPIGVVMLRSVAKVGDLLGCV